MIEFESFDRIFNTVMALNGFSDYATEQHSRTFYKLTDHMLTVNQNMNLTAIKDEESIIPLHYADSLTAAPFLPQNARVIDVGCGAGFPCLPLAICRPDLVITALDSTEKRIRYVADTAKLLGCHNLNAIAARAEEMGQGAFREQFDVCTARAVAALPLLAELCLPLVRVGGTFLAMKGRRGEEELKEAQSAIKRLGGECIAVHTVTLKGAKEEESRYLIEIKKVKPTPAEFPRPWARILKKPL